MKFIVRLTILLITCHLQLNAQKKEVLITIEDTRVTKAEFERIYRKNNQNLLEESDAKTPEEYIKLYIDFKLKVLEAMNLKMDTVQTFRDELAGYRKELAAPYLTDMKYDETMVRELYERTTKQINASHILLLADENASPGEENSVLEKINRIREELISGKDFSEAAVQYSEDPSAQMNRGNLGYFSAFQMITPFENAAFSTPVGEISQPVRTSYGYHLIKVHDVRENPGEIKVAHIMKMFPGEGDIFTREDKKDEIDSLYIALTRGADFAELARLHSDDERSAVQGGEMPWFSAGQMIPEFAEPAFQLKNPGEISKPVETPFGYHIIKKLDHRPPPSFDDKKEELEERIKKDPHRNNNSRQAFLSQLKKIYGYTCHTENLDAIANKEVAADLPGDMPLFTIDQSEYSVQEFINYLQKKQITHGTFRDHFEAWTEEEILALEDRKLEDKYPEFRYLMQEYHDGLLLFNIMEEKIWRFAGQDSAGLNAFYRNHREKFSWQERFDGVIITCKDPETREKAEKLIDAGTENEEIKEILNQDEVNVEIRKGVWEKGDHPVIDHQIWHEPAPSGYSPQLTIVRGQTLPPAPKTLDEAKGLYISEYQNFLENEWLKKLHKKYKVKINQRLLKTIPHV